MHRKCLGIPLSTGQNIAMSYENWTEVIEGWIEEKEHYYHSFPSPNIFSHYTQVNILVKRQFQCLLIF